MEHSEWISAKHRIWAVYTSLVLLFCTVLLLYGKGGCRLWGCVELTKLFCVYGFSCSGLQECLPVRCKWAVPRLLPYTCTTLWDFFSCLQIYCGACSSWFSHIFHTLCRFSCFISPPRSHDWTMAAHPLVMPGWKILPMNFHYRVFLCKLRKAENRNPWKTEQDWEQLQLSHLL